VITNITLTNETTAEGEPCFALRLKHNGKDKECGFPGSDEGVSVEEAERMFHWFAIAVGRLE
jgi:hypothetical protein